MRMRSKKVESFDICIPAAIMDRLIIQNLSPYETRILLFLLWQKYRTEGGGDRTYLSTIAESVGLDRRNLDRTLDKLSSKRMILKKPDEKRKHQRIVELRDIKDWKLTSKKTEKT